MFFEALGVFYGLFGIFLGIYLYLRFPDDTLTITLGILSIIAGVIGLAVDGVFLLTFITKGE